jgi:hypothetical protein
MLQSHHAVWLRANYVGTEDAAIGRLDSPAPEVVQEMKRLF